jgi:hypothetical protein
MSRVSLEKALETVLGELELTYVIENELLLITTPEAAEAHACVELYSVESLTGVGWDFVRLKRFIEDAEVEVHCELLGRQAAVFQSQPAHRRTASQIRKLSGIGGAD